MNRSRVSLRSCILQQSLIAQRAAVMQVENGCIIETLKKLVDLVTKFVDEGDLDAAEQLSTLTQTLIKYKPVKSQGDAHSNADSASQANFVENGSDSEQQDLLNDEKKENTKFDSTSMQLEVAYKRIQQLEMENAKLKEQLNRDPQSKSITRSEANRDDVELVKESRAPISWMRMQDLVQQLVLIKVKKKKGKK